MNTETKTDEIKALPVRFIEFDGGVILKRSCVEFHVGGQGALEVLQFIIREASVHGGIKKQVLIDSFAAPDRPAVAELVGQLEQRSILVPLYSSHGHRSETEAEESCQDVFYWNFDRTEKQVTESLNSKKLVILGVNHISRQLSMSLLRSGCHHFDIVDIPTLRNLDLYNEDGVLNVDAWGTMAPLAEEQGRQQLDSAFDCLIATADMGGLYAMREWNRFCITRGIHFLPVVLQNLVGYLGPLVVPGDTPCFECLRARQNANLEDPEGQRATELTAYEDQAVTGSHPSMASVLADLAAIELGKFYGGWSSPASIGQLTQVHLMTPAITHRKVLKAPRCSACSPMNQQSSMVVQKDFYMPGNEES